MKARTFASIQGKGIITLAALPLYLLFIRPGLLCWGARSREVEGPWPGDDLIPTPAFSSTRAVSVGAPAAAIWPWLCQMGAERAGTYSYAVLEHLVRLDTLNIEWIVPRFQQLATNDWPATCWNHSTF